MILTLGEILFDIFPHYRRLGGAPFNVAWHLHRMGFQSLLFSRTGTDTEGDEIDSRMRDYGMETSCIQRDTNRPTGRVEVQLDDKGIPDFSILPDMAYDYIEFSTALREVLASPPDLIYFGTLIQRTPAAASVIHQAIEKSPDVPTLYDMNFRPHCVRLEAVEWSLHHTTILKLNDEEMNTLSRMTSYHGNNSDFIPWLMKEYGIEAVALTEGGEGSTLYMDGNIFPSPKPDPVSIADTVGAGDGYAAVLAAGYLSGDDPARIVEEATAFSARLCEIEGAVPENNSIYTTVRYFHE